MCEEYREMEECVVDMVLLKNSIEQICPEIVRMILNIHGDIDTYTNSIENKESISRILGYLSGRSCPEQKVILWRYGLIDGKTKTLEEVAQIMGVARWRVRQLESNALRHGGCRIYRRKRLVDILEEN